MLKRGLVVAFATCVGMAYSQDIHFTQVATNNMLANPAATGMFHGWERIGANHKNQWVNAGTKYYSTSIAADLNIAKPKRGNKAHLGLGVQFYNDIGGDSKIGQKQFYLNVSGIVPLAEMHEISGGLQIGVGQRTGDIGGLLFPNQFNGNQLDPTMVAGEGNPLISFMYPDIGLGLLYKFGNHAVGFNRDHQTEFTIGGSYSHLTSPKLKYRAGGTEKLYGKVTIHANLLKDFDGSKYGVEAFGYQFIQGKHYETLLGAMLRIRLSSGSKTTGLTRDAYLKAGLAMRIKDAIAPMVHIQFGSFDFGVSYDITISKLGAVAPRGGGLEFSLIYTNRDFALFKSRSRI